MAQFTIGVDLGGTNLRIAAVDEAGRILQTINTATEVARGRDAVVKEMCEAIRSLALKHHSAGSLLGIGIGVPGIIDMNSGMIRRSPNLPDWQNYPVKQEIERLLSTDVYLENDANSAALGEKWLGAGKAENDICMFTLGTGVGGGIILDGKVWHGMTGMAAELGHINVEPNGHPCGCGSKGCLEQYASATAVRRMAKEAIARGGANALEKLSVTDAEFNGKTIFELAMKGDKAAQGVYQRAGGALGIVIAGMINALNLPMYVIGGGVSNSWDAFAPAMMDQIKLRSFVYAATLGDDPNAPHVQRTEVRKAMLGGDAGLLGAARLPTVS
jgi:glucokinase